MEPHGPKRRSYSGSLAIGVRFAFEMLDLFIGHADGRTATRRGGDGGRDQPTDARTDT